MAVSDPLDPIAVAIIHGFAHLVWLCIHVGFCIVFWSAPHGRWAVLAAGAVTATCMYALRCTPPSYASRRSSSTSVRDVEQDADEVHEKHCKLCDLPQQLGTVHCMYCNRCTHHFDHHCVFTGHCIARRNHARFWLFLLAQVAAGFVCMHQAIHNSSSTSALATLAQMGFLTLSLIFIGGLLAVHTALACTGHTSRSLWQQIRSSWAVGARTGGGRAWARGAPGHRPSLQVTRLARNFGVFLQHVVWPDMQWPHEWGSRADAEWEPPRSIAWLDAVCDNKLYSCC